MESSDQRPRRFRFSLAMLLVSLTLVGVLFGVVGVPATLFLGAWLAAMGLYVFVAQRLGTGLALVAFFVFIWLAMIALQSVHFAFR
jgi:hypothetical protein